MAHEYLATVSWKRGGDEPFSDNKYSRGHTWAFDGGVTVPASSSPLSVRLPFSQAPMRSTPRRRWWRRCRAATC